MRSKSKRRPKEHAQWIQRHTVCWLCGWSPGDWSAQGKFWLTTHEIVRGCDRAKGVKLSAAWIRVCNVCHGVVDGWPVSKQLWFKREHDPDNYDRVAVNLARGRQPEAITEEEVAQWDALDCLRTTH